MRVFLSQSVRPSNFFFFFFNDTATTEIYTLSLHDALPIFHRTNREGFKAGALENGLKTAKGEFVAIFDADFLPEPDFRSEEHTSELQSQSNLVCRLLLEKKKKIVRKQQIAIICHIICKLTI